jgi:SAM-dependent methyltransferase
MSDRLEPLRRLARHVPGAIALGRRVRRGIDPDLRELARLERDHGKALLQPFTDTEEDRYPQLFDALAERLAGLARPRILSFGCSNGAELRALRRRMPNARLTGIDLNARAIRIARKLDPVSEYHASGTPPGDARFDAILALAVFRHGQLEAGRPADCSAILPFARVAETISRLDTVLEPRGWLAIWHAHFRFADMPTAIGYEADPLRISDAPMQDLLWGADDRLMEHESYADVLFRKRS